MRDRDNTLGKITLATTTEQNFAQGIDMRQGGLGLYEDLFLNFKTDRALTSSDGLVIAVKESDSTGAGTDVIVKSFPKQDYPAGHVFSVKLPREHKRYISASAKLSTGSTAAVIWGYLEMG